jgi:pantetheine-phosphate adenylyltransferase
MIKGIYTGSFDPLTLGHVDIIVRASKLFDLTIGVATNPSKKPLFHQSQRVVQIIETFKDLSLNVKVREVNGLLAKYCAENDIKVVVRGLRNSVDFEYEFGMAHVNSGLGDLETIFLPAQGAQTHVSSSVVRQLAQLGADYTPYVPKVIQKALHEVFAND